MYWMYQSQSTVNVNDNLCNGIAYAKQSYHDILFFFSIAAVAQRLCYYQHTRMIFRFYVVSWFTEGKTIAAKNGLTFHSLMYFFLWVCTFYEVVLLTCTVRLYSAVKRILLKIVNHT